jgi:hypothetical protein
MLSQVVLSYRCESPEHAWAMGRFGELRQHVGIPVELDQV